MAINLNNSILRSCNVSSNNNEVDGSKKSVQFHDLASNDDNMEDKISPYDLLSEPTADLLWCTSSPRGSLENFKLGYNNINVINSNKNNVSFWSRASTIQDETSSEFFGGRWLSCTESFQYDVKDDENRNQVSCILTEDIKAWMLPLKNSKDTEFTTTVTKLPDLSKMTDRKYNLFEYLKTKNILFPIAEKIPVSNNTNNDECRSKIAERKTTKKPRDQKPPRPIRRTSVSNSADQKPPRPIRRTSVSNSAA